MWKIQYNQRLPEWHPKSGPGEFDEKANEIAEIIVNAVNKELFNDK